MRRGLRITLKVPAAIILVIGIGIIVYLSIPYESDFGTFARMRSETLAIAERNGFTPLPINRDFEDYRVGLNPIMALMFKRMDLGLTLETFQSDRLKRFSISQMEIGKGSGIFFDFTFMARPVTSIHAPVFHCDILRPFPGTDGALYMDFYILNENTDLDAFFAEELEVLEDARESVRKYWKHEGFGELTTYMDSYKSKYRVEILEPESSDETKRREYYSAARRCFFSYLEAYLRALEKTAHSASREEAEENRESFQTYVEGNVKSHLKAL